MFAPSGARTKGCSATHAEIVCPNHRDHVSALSGCYVPPRVQSRATVWEPLSAQMMELRFTAAAKVAGVESRVTAHSGRVGLASELTSRGASIFPETSLPLDLPDNEEAGSRWAP